MSIPASKRRAITAWVLAAAALSGLPALADGGVQTDDGRWYFRGSTYSDEEGHRPSDPINLIFYGGGDVTNVGVKTHMADDWRLGGPMKPQGSLMCKFKGAQHMFWRNFPGESEDKNDISESTGVPLCGRQYHHRGWDDFEHSRDVGHNRRRWNVGNIHHEHRTGFLEHHIDRDFDLVRLQAVRAMKRHCSYPRWESHPGAQRAYRRDYATFYNSGWIARISMRHRDAGCGGA